MIACGISVLDTDTIVAALPFMPILHSSLTGIE